MLLHFPTTILQINILVKARIIKNIQYFKIKYQTNKLSNLDFPKILTIFKL